MKNLKKWICIIFLITIVFTSKNERCIYENGATDIEILNEENE